MIPFPLTGAFMASRHPCGLGMNNHMGDSGRDGCLDVAWEVLQPRQDDAVTLTVPRGHEQNQGCCHTRQRRTCSLPRYPLQRMPVHCGLHLKAEEDVLWAVLTQQQLGEVVGEEARKGTQNNQETMSDPNWHGCVRKSPCRYGGCCDKFDFPGPSEPNPVRLSSTLNLML